MLLVAHVHNAIVRAKAVGMNGRSQINFAANNGLNAGLFTVRDDLSIDPAIALIDAEDDRLASCSTSTLATHPSRTEIAFIHFDFARGEGRGALAFGSDAGSDFEKDRRSRCGEKVPSAEPHHWLSDRAQSGAGVDGIYAPIFSTADNSGLAVACQ